MSGILNTYAPPTKRPLDPRITLGEQTDMAANKIMLGQGVGNSPIESTLPVAGGFWTLIETILLASAVSSMTFSGISAAFKHLRLVCEFIPQGSGHFRMQFNDDTGANYSYLRVNLAAAYFGQSTNGASYIEALSMFGGLRNIYAEIDISNNVAAYEKDGSIRSPRWNNSFGITPFIWDNTSDKISKIKLFPSTSTLNAGTEVHLLGK